MDVLLKGFKSFSFGLQVNLECVVRYSPDDLIFDVYIGQIILTQGACEVAVNGYGSEVVDMLASVKKPSQSSGVMNPVRSAMSKFVQLFMQVFSYVAELPKEDCYYLRRRRTIYQASDCPHTCTLLHGLWHMTVHTRACYLHGLWHLTVHIQVHHCMVESAIIILHFSFVSLFNCISTFMGYLMPKTSL